MLDNIDFCGDDDFFFVSFARAIAAALKYSKHQTIF